MFSNTVKLLVHSINNQFSIIKQYESDNLRKFPSVNVAMMIIIIDNYNYNNVVYSVMQRFEEFHHEASIYSFCKTNLTMVVR